MAICACYVLVYLAGWASRVKQSPKVNDTQDSDASRTSVQINEPMKRAASSQGSADVKTLQQALQSHAMLKISSREQNLRLEKERELRTELQRSLAAAREAEKELQSTLAAEQELRAELQRSLVAA
ncbi:hypothetical protein BCR37DRAFT_391030 [Protomyces lactucae-debilis]|uniref:Uncharacterized protein n=1 Tax=Protomyces lactucae-debilis TaxID=2754530 RepID=A0A1Y2FSF5_PROLT|nr:uncharacterized protein BCR37DRAFT_391030 [Protomyces lactucae-debilis]ORY86234.1 hypothetical protein BCR37DRAFT_391030 [Protomyces lactucae-debilis]